MTARHRGKASGNAGRDERRRPPAPAATQVQQRRRPRIVIGAIALGVVAAAVVGVVWLRVPAAPPNVLLITIDTLRADHVGCYRREFSRAVPALHIETPMLDRLAARGTLFVNTVAQVPLTLPSHASMLTGLAPPAHGLRDNAGFTLARGVPTVAEQFRRAGYATAAFVSGYPLDHRFGLDRGFDAYDDRFPRGDDPGRPFVERRADATVRLASAWLRQTAAAGRPFLAWVHLFDPHAPYDPPEPFRSRFADHPYDGEIAFVDSQVGRLLDGLSDAGVLKHTVVVVIADHGEGLGEHNEATHGLLIYDSTIRIPLIVAGPGAQSGLRVADLARAIDVAPTLLDFAGLPAVKGTDGRSLRPAAQGRRLAAEPAYVESLFGRLNFGWAPLYGWRSKNLMLIDAPRPELYDVQADPAQLRDLAAVREADVQAYRRDARLVADRATRVERTAVSAETRERLGSLGYVSGASAARDNPMRNPMDFAALAYRVEKAITLEHSDPPAAIGEFRAALREDPDNVLAREHLAMSLSRVRRFDEALAEANGLLAAGDTSADLLTLVGECLRVTGRHDAALEAFRRASERDPRAADPVIGTARTLVALGRRDEARDAFTRVLALAPDSPDALVGLADLALEAGDVAQARARLERVHDAGRADSGADLKLGVLLVRQREVDRAIQIFREVCERDPRNIDALVDLGGALAKSGRTAEALPYFERAAATGVAAPVVWNSLAMARLETGNQAGGVDALRQSLRLKADQPDIAAMLRKLQGQ